LRAIALAPYWPTSSVRPLFGVFDLAFLSSFGLRVPESACGGRSGLDLARFGVFDRRRGRRQ
jgi:hypothetical protein